MNTSTCIGTLLWDTLLVVPSFLRQDDACDLDDACDSCDNEMGVYGYVQRS